MVLFLRNERFNFMLFWGGDYYLRWWRLPIEERACRKTDLGGADYYLRNSGLPPSSGSFADSISLFSLHLLRILLRNILDSASILNNSIETMIIV